MAPLAVWAALSFLSACLGRAEWRSLPSQAQKGNVKHGTRGCQSDCAAASATVAARRAVTVTGRHCATGLGTVLDAQLRNRPRPWAGPGPWPVPSRGPRPRRRRARVSGRHGHVNRVSTAAAAAAAVTSLSHGSRPGGHRPPVGRLSVETGTGHSTVTVTSRSHLQPGRRGNSVESRRVTESVAESPADPEDRDRDRDHSSWFTGNLSAGVTLV